MSRRYFVAGFVAAAVVALDLWTKRFAALNFVDNPVVVIPDFFGFTYTENPGAAFSLFQNAGPVLGVAAVVITVVLLASLRNEMSQLTTIAYGFVMGGALGNFADRLFRADQFLDGRVIDWVNLSIIPTFNVADASITVAVALLIIDAWRRR